MTRITVNLKGCMVNISVSLPTAVILLMMIWAWRGQLKLILRVTSEASQLGAVINRTRAEAWTLVFLWALVLVSGPIFRNTFNYKSRCLKKRNCIPCRKIRIMTYEGGPTLCMVLSLRQSCSNQTVGEKIRSINFSQLIVVFFPLWPWIFNRKFSRRWLKTAGDERSCSKQSLSQPSVSAGRRLAVITPGKGCSSASVGKVALQMAAEDRSGLSHRLTFTLPTDTMMRRTSIRAFAKQWRSSRKVWSTRWDVAESHQRPRKEQMHKASLWQTGLYRVARSVTHLYLTEKKKLK